MSPRLDGAREASLSRWLAFTPFILQKSRMRRRARTDLCGGRSAMGVPTATVIPRSARKVAFSVSSSGPALQQECSYRNRCFKAPDPLRCVS